MIGIVALHLRTHIHGVIASALRREGTQSLGCEQLTCADIEHTLLLILIEGRIVESHSKNHVGTHAPVHQVAIDIIEEVTIFVEEGLHEGGLTKFCTLLKLGGTFPVVGVRLEGSTELQCIIPQCIKLYDISATGHHWAAVGGGVHPSDSLITAVGIEQSVVVEMEIGMTLIHDIVDDIVNQLSIADTTCFLARLLGILLDGPYRPQRHVGLIYLIDTHREGFAFHKLTQPSLCCLHHQFKIVLLIDGKCQTWQGDKGVAGTTLKPWIASEEITVVVLLTLMELMGGVHQTVEEIVAWRTLFHLFLKETLQCGGGYR